MRSLCLPLLVVGVALVGAVQQEAGLLNLAPEVGEAGAPGMANIDALGAVLKPIDKYTNVKPITAVDSSAGGGTDATKPQTKEEAKEAATSAKEKARDKVAQEAASETLTAADEAAKEEKDQNEDTISELAKENEEADKKQFEFEKQRALRRKEAEDRIAAEQQAIEKKKQEFKKASFDEATRQQQSAERTAAEKAKMAQLLETKVDSLKNKVSSLTQDSQKSHEKLKQEETQLLKTKLELKGAKLKYDEASSTFEAQNKIVDDTKRQAESAASSLARVRIELLKAEDRRDDSKLSAEHAEEAKRLAQQDTQNTQAELQKVSNATSFAANVTKSGVESLDEFLEGI